MLDWLRRLAAKTSAAAVAQRPATLGDPLARIPAGVWILAIGDVHGRADLLSAMLARFDALVAEARPAHVTIVLLGDLIDRGPASSEVLDIIVERSQRQYVVTILGNHERMMLKFLDGAAPLKDWVRYGGLETLQSYGIAPAASGAEGIDEPRDSAARLVPKAHVDLLRSSRLVWTYADLTFVHAGLRPGVPLDEQADDDVLLIRDEFLDHDGSFGSFVVHGHTPVGEIDLRHNRLNLDTGAFATGKLSGAIFTREGVRPLIVNSSPHGGEVSIAPMRLAGS